MELSLSKIEDRLVENAGALAFFYQLTQKDLSYAMSSGYWTSLNSTQKLQMLADIVAGRITGYNPFPAVATYQQTFQIGQAINNTSIAGAIVWGLSSAGLIAAKWAKVGKEIMVWGAAGGVFDAPGRAPGAGNPTPVQGPGRAAGAPSGPIAAAAVTATGNYFGK